MIEECLMVLVDVPKIFFGFRRNVRLRWLIRAHWSRIPDHHRKIARQTVSEIVGQEARHVSTIEVLHRLALPSLKEIACEFDLWEEFLPFLVKKLRFRLPVNPSNVER